MKLKNRKKDIDIYLYIPSIDETYQKTFSNVIILKGSTKVAMNSAFHRVLVLTLL